MTQQFIDSLLGQSFIVVVVVVVLIFLYKEYKRYQKKLEEKDSQLLELSKDVIKLATFWEVKGSKLGEEDEEFKDLTVTLLKEIKVLVKNVQTGG